MRIFQLPLMLMTTCSSPPSLRPGWAQGSHIPRGNQAYGRGLGIGIFAKVPKRGASALACGTQGAIPYHVGVVSGAQLTAPSGSLGVGPLQPPLNTASPLINPWGLCPLKGMDGLDFTVLFSSGASELRTQKGFPSEPQNVTPFIVHLTKSAGPFLFKGKKKVVTDG